MFPVQRLPKYYYRWNWEMNSRRGKAFSVALFISQFKWKRKIVPGCVLSPIHISLRLISSTAPRRRSITLTTRKARYWSTPSNHCPSHLRAMDNVIKWIDWYLSKSRWIWYKIIYNRYDWRRVLMIIKSFSILCVAAKKENLVIFPLITQSDATLCIWS